MGFLTRKCLVSAAIPLLISVLGCSGGGDLTSVASTLVETQRLANLTRAEMSGTWKGFLQSEGPERAEQTIYLVFSDDEGLTLVQSLMILENIELDGTVSQDTFTIENAVFDDRLRFNISPWPSGPLVIDSGHPVLFEGELSENSFVSGELRAGTRKIAVWEAVLFQPAQGGGATP